MAGGERAAEGGAKRDTMGWAEFTQFPIFCFFLKKRMNNRKMLSRTLREIRGRVQQPPPRAGAGDDPGAGQEVWKINTVSRTTCKRNS